MSFENSQPKKFVFFQKTKKGHGKQEIKNESKTNEVEVKRLWFLQGREACLRESSFSQLHENLCEWNHKKEQSRQP